MKALALKELRELRGIALCGLGLYFLLIGRIMGLRAFEWIGSVSETTDYPALFNGDYLSLFGFMAAVLGIAIGFRQTAWESSRGTFLFLLHRPISRRAVFLTKLGTGGLVYLACSCGPLLLYAWWAATPGNVAGPFRWSWTIPVWTVNAYMLLVYVGAFLSGLRPARWFGTRLFPIAAALLLVTLLFLAAWQTVFQQTSLLLAIQLGTLALSLGAAILAVCYVAQIRDYA
jgi:hypothetical protein